MKDNEIIQEATEAVTKGYPCAFYVPQLLEVIKNKEAEIEKKDTEIEILIRKKEALRDDISELTAEIERLQSVLKQTEKDFNKVYKMNFSYAKQIKQSKSEAYREFVMNVLRRIGFCELPNAVVRGHINKAYEELTRNLHGTCTETTDQTATNHSVSLIDGHIEE